MNEMARGDAGSGSRWAIIAACAVAAAAMVAGCDEPPPRRAIQPEPSASGLDAPPRPAGISAPITGRSTPEVLEQWANTSIEMVEGEPIDPLTRIVEAMSGVVVDCQHSVLSLGEGRSTFAHQLLHERRRFLELPAPAWSKPAADTCGVSNIHALDVSYPKHGPSGQITCQRAPTPTPAASEQTYDALTLQWIREFPANYHSQAFREMDIRGPAGKRRQFSLVLSTWALTLVMCRHMDADGQRAVLRRVVDHLALGGLMLATPLRRTWGACLETCFDELGRLKTAGRIRNFSVVPAGESPRFPLAILR